MWQLILASLLWAASYSFNKVNLAGFNPFLISTIFCLSSSLVFLPWLRFSNISGQIIAKLFSIGAIQFGLMYIFFQSSFFFLDAHEIAILLITTPFYVVLIGGIFDKRTLALPLFLASLCVIFSLCTVANGDYTFDSRGALLIQLSNVAFACGQVLLKHFFNKNPSVKLTNVMGILYIGGGFICLIFALASCGSNYLPLTIKAGIQACLLGIICCGVCHYLWDVGAIRVKIPLLAIMNNVQIPLAVLISAMCFGEVVQLRKILTCIAMIAFVATVARAYKCGEK
jgi:drug/metabolite transporter (DMT)-like permease